jgi:signal transduction histidine kinase/CheY-like chemotaxis protein
VGWRRWFSADPRITDLGERRTAELVAYLIMLMTVVSVVGVGTGVLLDATWVVDRVPAFATLTASWMILFVVNRSRYYRLAAVLVALAPLISNLGVGLTSPEDPAWYSFVPITAILAAALLDLRRAAFVAALCFLSTVAVVAFHGEAYFVTQGTAALGYVFMTCILVLGMARFRNQLERERVAEVERLAQQLAATERLESIGRFAGGVAHDFNNLLTVILANIELARRDRNDPSLLAEIEDAATRASALTGQLLAFTRHRPAPSTSVAMEVVVHGMQPLLRRLVPEHIELVLDVRSTWPVFLDQPQLEQVVMNLAANARDAMPGGGEVRFVTEDVAGGSDGIDMVHLVVSDSGMGMDATTRARALEPFFSTKPVGAGTGLGLATVDAIVRQAGGTIELDSTPGAGTTVTVRLPRGHRAARATTNEPAPVLATTRGVALLVEDDALVRAATERVLRELGLAVVVAASAAEVPRALADASGPLALVVSDVVMPGKNGIELVEELRAAHPELRAILMSGYSEQAITPRSGLRFLAKPFTVEALSSAVSELLAVQRPQVAVRSTS